jgi:hypothetical protein
MDLSIITDLEAERDQLRNDLAAAKVELAECRERGMKWMDDCVIAQNELAECRAEVEQLKDALK